MSTDKKDDPPNWRDSGGIDAAGRLRELADALEHNNAVVRHTYTVSEGREAASLIRAAMAHIQALQQERDTLQQRKCPNCGCDYKTAQEVRNWKDGGMNRRQALTAIFAIPIGAFTFTDAQANPAAPAFLRIQLDQWAGFSVEHQGRKIVLSSADIFDALHNE